MGTDILETASGLLIDPDGRILMGLRAAWKRVGADQWDAIGGRLESGETMEQALVRELGEEIGVEATHFEWLASIPEPRADLYGEALHHVFAVYAWNGAPANICDEHTEIRWFTAAEIAALSDTTDLDFPDLVAMALRLRPA
jgi:mutator protein MutT